MQAQETRGGALDYVAVFPDGYDAEKPYPLIVLLHGFAKKSQKLPRRELDAALRRLARFEEREGGDK